MKKSIGFDVSKANIDAAVFDGQGYNHLKTENSLNGFEHIIKSFNRLLKKPVSFPFYPIHKPLSSCQFSI